MGRADAVRSLLHRQWFPTLLSARLVSQCSDGVFQASLTSALLFNPEHHAGPARIAGGFALLLLPYSVVGPFAGVFIDRWRRQRILVAGAATRAVLVAATALLLGLHGPTGAAFDATAMVALAVNRFYLAALSAAVPNIVPDHELVLANALAPTSGTVATVAGGGIGLAVRAGFGHGDHADAAAAGVAVVGYVVASIVASRLPAARLGPHHRVEMSLRHELADATRGLVAGARHVRQRPAAFRALGVVLGQRFGFGLWTIMSLLLYRNSFRDQGVLRAGLTGIGQLVTAGGVGLVLAALVTPAVTRRIGMTRWISSVTAGVAVTVLVLGAPFTLPLIVVSALLLGFATQASKVCIDTILQEEVDDDFRGRAFAFYDTLYNVGLATACAVGAAILPASGRSVPALMAFTAGYLLIAAAYLAAPGRSVAPEQAAQQA